MLSLSLSILLACSPSSIALGDPEESTRSDSSAGGDTSTSSDTADSGRSEDTSSDTADSADDTSGGTTDCRGLAGVDPEEVEVSSMVEARVFEVTLAGCATGITVTDGYASFGDYEYRTTWVSVPSSVDGEATATVEFTGASESVETWLESYFMDDQGGYLVFTLHVVER